MSMDTAIDAAGLVGSRPLGGLHVFESAWFLPASVVVMVAVASGALVVAQAVRRRSGPRVGLVWWR
jgi:hypothetical protein